MRNNGQPIRREHNYLGREPERGQRFLFALADNAASRAHREREMMLSRLWQKDKQAAQVLMLADPAKIREESNAKS